MHASYFNCNQICRWLFVWPRREEKGRRREIDDHTFVGEVKRTVFENERNKKSLLAATCALCSHCVPPPERSIGLVINPGGRATRTDIYRVAIQENRFARKITAIVLASASAAVHLTNSSIMR